MFRLIFRTIPIDAMLTNKELPPYERNGSVIPVAKLKLPLMHR